MTDPGSNGPSGPLDFYKQRRAELQFAADEAVRLVGAYRRNLVILGLIACAMLYASFVAKTLPLWTCVLVIPVGAYFMAQSSRNNSKALKLFRLCDYYDAGIARLNRDWESLDEGLEFRDPDHFYATDLDIFGRGSLFQLLCSARTQAGRETLANWMMVPASREEVLARRAAISELRGRQDLREALAVAGSLKVSDCRPGTFRTWVAESISPFPSWGQITAPLLVAGY